MPRLHHGLVSRWLTNHCSCSLSLCASVARPVAPWHSNSAVPNTIKSHKPYLQCKTALCHLRPLATQKSLARCFAQLRKHITALLHSFYGRESCSRACTELQNLMSKSAHAFSKICPMSLWTCHAIFWMHALSCKRLSSGTLCRVNHVVCQADACLMKLVLPCMHGNP